MALEQAYEYRHKENLQLQNENRKLQKKLDQLAAGTYTNEEKAQNIRTINRLTQENQHLKNQLERYLSLLFPNFNLFSFLGNRYNVIARYGSCLLLVCTFCTACFVITTIDHVNNLSHI